MKIVRTNTITNTREVVSFNEVYKRFFSKSSWTQRIWLNYRLLDNVTLQDREYEYKREIS